MDIEALLEQGNRISIKPKGYSMYPLIMPGRDAVFVEKVEINRLKRGDVVLYRRENGLLVLHRIWKKKKDSFFLVGDNQKEIEGPIRPNQIKGKMTALIRRGIKVTVRHPVYCLYSRLWLFLRPARPWISQRIHALRKKDRTA